MRRGRVRPGVRVECLEERRLLSTLSIDANNTLIYAADAGSASDLRIAVDPVDSTRVILTDPDQTIALGSGTADWTSLDNNDVAGPLASFKDVVVNGSTDMGQGLTLDYSFGDPLHAQGLDFAPTGATGGASNALTLTPGEGANPTTFLGETYDATGAGKGKITYSDATNSNVPITFSNLTPVNDLVTSPSLIVDAPATATAVNVVDGPPNTTEINDTNNAFERIDFANKAAVTVNVNNTGATTTVDATAANGMTDLLVNSGAGNDTIDVLATPSGVTTTTDTGGPSGSSTDIGNAGTLGGIQGPVIVQSTSGSNALTIDDSATQAPTTYTLDGGAITADSMPATITLGDTGITTLTLKSAPGSTIDLKQLGQQGVKTYHFDGTTGPGGTTTLNINSNVSTLNFNTAGTLGFGTNEPAVDYSNIGTINVTKPAAPPIGSGVVIRIPTSLALSNVTVATFTESDPTNVAADFTATIDWGDGTTTPGTVQSTGGNTFAVVGSHTYAKGGVYSLKVAPVDQNTSGFATVGGTTINVTANGPVPSVPTPILSTALGLYQNSVYNFSGVGFSAEQDVQTTQDVAIFQSTDNTATASDFRATIDWGDNSPGTAGTIVEDAFGFFHVVGTHTYTKAGSFEPTVTISDINGETVATGALYQTNLVSSVPGLAAVIDPNLINPWGMSSSRTSPIWISNQGSGVSTVYNPNASPITTLLTVTVPPGGTPSGPTGQVFNNDPNTGDFIVPGSSPAAPARFLFATLAGTIDAWASGATATIAVPAVPGAVFTGLAQASVTSGGATSFYLYAADFNGTTGASGIDVFDKSFASVTGAGGAFNGTFVDPNAIAGYNPYNIAILNGNLYVAYAKPNGIVTSPGGYIDEFTTAGAFVARIYTDTTGTNHLSGPWGMAIAPSGFDGFGGDLLVGNFGDSSASSPSGTIIAIDLTNNTYAGTLTLGNGQAVENAGQWGLLFGNGGLGGSMGTLYLTAGIDGQTQGLFAQIAPAGAGTATVLAAPLTAVGATVDGIEGHSLTTAAAGVLVATFQDTGTPGTAASYTATIDWGDGTTSAPISITRQGNPNGIVYSVFGNHTYATPGTYPVNVTITNATANNGAVVIASGRAVIVDAALTPATPQPNVSATEARSFSGVVAAFDDGNPAATAGQFTYVMIDWGDGTPATAGAITQPGGAGTAFFVSGTHTYGDAGVNGGVGLFPITVNAHDVDGSTVTIGNTANVADTPIFVSGKLNPASDSGVSDTDNITNVVQPNFFGTVTEPGATIMLYAYPSGSSTPIVIGRGSASASGTWDININQPLADGAYRIAAIATDAAGNTTSASTTIAPNLVIDTVGPKVTSLNFNRLQGRIVAGLQDYGGAGNAGVGLVLPALVDASNYQLVTVHHPRVGKYRINAASVVPGTTAGGQTVTLTINRGRYLKGNWYQFTIFAAGPTLASGIQDIAGNALDGEFYGYFPSGNNVRGGNFVAQITAFHHTIYAPSTLIGRATPVHPPGHRQGKVIDPRTYNPGKVAHSHAAARPRRASQQARSPVRDQDLSRGTLVHRSGDGPASGGPVAMGALDLAVDQLGTAGKHRRS